MLLVVKNIGKICIRWLYVWPLTYSLYKSGANGNEEFEKATDAGTVHTLLSLDVMVPNAAIRIPFSNKLETVVVAFFLVTDPVPEYELVVPWAKVNMEPTIQAVKTQSTLFILRQFLILRLIL